MGVTHDATEFPTNTTIGKVPRIRCTGRIEFDNIANDRPAVVIGQSNMNVFNADVELYVINKNQSDWSNDNCRGIVLYNFNSATNIRIRRSTCFTHGVVYIGENHGVSYNTTTLGYIVDNKYGVTYQSLGTGWVNENTITGGRIGVSSSTNITRKRYGLFFKPENASSNVFNNNRFYGLSFELSNAAAIGLSTAVSLSNAKGNHIYNARAEQVSRLAEIDNDATYLGTSYDNLIDFGYSQVSDHGVIDRGLAGNVVTTSWSRSSYESHDVFYLDDLSNKVSLSAGTPYVSGADVYTRATGAVADKFTTGNLTATGLELTDNAEAIGKLIDTSIHKHFTATAGYAASNGGGRVYAVCFDSGGSVISNTLTGSGATATATVSGGVVTGVVVDTGGSNYVQGNVFAEVQGNAGENAVLAVTVTAGAVASIAVTDGGTGYTDGTIAVSFAFDKSVKSHTLSPMAADGVGYITGNNSLHEQHLFFNDNVKSAFIGICRGTSTNPIFNSIRISTINLPHAGTSKQHSNLPPPIPTSATYNLFPNFKWGIAAPTSGTHKVGDRVYNLDQTGGSTNARVIDYWYCSVAGTSGTWVARYITDETNPTNAA
jgi:hypothetical protein